MKDAKPKRRFALSPKSMGLMLAGAFFFLTPYFIEHNGYGGKILIATTGANPPFDKALVLIGEHSIEGAMGIIVNQPLSDSDKAGLSPFIRDSGIPVAYGGPLETSNRLFVMEEKPPAKPGDNPDLEISDWDEAVRTTPDLLSKIHDSIQKGEQHYRLFTGFASWSPFQLETEVLVRHMWYAITATHELVFQTNAAEKWDILEKREKTKREPKPDQS